MTTPRDAIGLSEITSICNGAEYDARYAARHMPGHPMQRNVEALRETFKLIRDKADEAATQLDALQARVKELEENITEIPQLLREVNARATRAEQERDKLRSFTQELSDALLACRPLGGSELFVKRLGQYYADPVYCKAAIEQRIEAYHEAMKESVRNRKRAEKAEQERDEAYERAAGVADKCATDFMAGGSIDPQVHVARKVAQHVAAAIHQLKIRGSSHD